MMHAGYSKIAIEIDLFEIDDSFGEFQQIGPTLVRIVCQILEKLNRISQVRIFVSMNGTADRDLELDAHMREQMPAVAYAMKELLMLPKMNSAIKSFYLSALDYHFPKDFLCICKGFIPPIIDMCNIEVSVLYEDSARCAISGYPRTETPVTTSATLHPPYRMSSPTSGYLVSIYHEDDWQDSRFFLPVTAFSYMVGSATRKYWECLTACAATIKTLTIKIENAECGPPAELLLVNLRMLKWSCAGKDKKILTKLVGALRTPALTKFMVESDSLEGLHALRDVSMTPFFRSSSALLRCNVHLRLPLASWTTALSDGVEAARIALIAHKIAMVLTLDSPLPTFIRPPIPPRPGCIRFPGRPASPASFTQNSSFPMSVNAHGTAIVRAATILHESRATQLFGPVGSDASSTGRGLSNGPHAAQLDRHWTSDDEKALIISMVEARDIEKVGSQKSTQAFSTTVKLQIPSEFLTTVSFGYQPFKKLVHLQHLVIFDTTDLGVLTAYFRSAYLPILSVVECYGYYRVDQTTLSEAAKWSESLPDLVNVSLGCGSCYVRQIEVEAAIMLWASKGITLEIDVGW